MKKETIVKIKSSIRNSDTSSITLADKVSGPLTTVKMNNGKPNAKQISKILLPRALEIASL